MALLEEAVYTRLTTFAGLVALIGTRVYALRLPQKPTLPAVTWRVISGERFSAMAVDIGDVGTRVQVDAWSDDFDHATRGVIRIAAQVRAAMTRWTGTVLGIEIQDSYFENEVHFDEGPDVDARHHIALDFRVYSRE